MKKGHSESVWVCHNHEGGVITQTNVKYSDIENAGIPFCIECDRDMEFATEVWIED